MVESSEAHRGKRKKPYNERSDLEKLQSQWNKLSGLHLRDEPSAAIEPPRVCRRLQLPNRMEP